jgi:hypothetical protein
MQSGCGMSEAPQQVAPCRDIQSVDGKTDEQSDFLE